MKTDYELTILIPTYNRFEGLKNTVTKLSKQTCQNFQVIISDNGSDYAVDTVLEGFSESFINRIRIIKRGHNVGQNINITDILNFCKTRLAWTLSDDDEIVDEAVEKIYYYASQNSQFGILDFSVFSDFCEGTILELVSLQQFADFYYEKQKPNSLWHGNLIFYSNKVYNMEYISEYIEEALFYCYSYLGTMIILVRCLEKNIPYILIDEQIVKRETKYSNGMSWNFYKAYLASRILMDIPINIDRRLWKKLMKVFIFDIRDMITTAFVINPSLPPFLGKDYFKILYKECYRKILPFKQKVFLFLISQLFKNDLGKKMIRRIAKRVM